MKIVKGKNAKSYRLDFMLGDCRQRISSGAETEAAAWKIAGYVRELIAAKETRTALSAECTGWLEVCNIKTER